MTGPKVTRPPQDAHPFKEARNLQAAFLYLTYHVCITAISNTQKRGLFSRVELEAQTSQYLTSNPSHY